MSTYRTGGHWGVTIVREGDGSRCGRPDHDCDRGHLAAVVVDGGDLWADEFAERIVRGLHLLALSEALPCPHGHPGGERCGPCSFDRAIPPADSCTCSLPHAADPACPVHQGRKARGPKPPPVGRECFCDGSGRTCPRHGVVL